MFYFGSTGINNESGYNKHYHSALEFYFLTRGQCNYLIGDKLYEINEGDLVFIPEGVIHETSYSGAHSRMLINCTDEFLSDFPLPQFAVFRNINTINEIKEIFNKIKNEYTLKDSLSTHLINGYMHQLIAITYRNENLYHNKSFANKYLKSALEYIHNNFCSDITLTAIAEKFKVSKEHLSRVFKKETGLNFSEYLSQLRLKKAEEMLCYGNETIAEIAYSCGFNDSNYFSEKFKRLYKLSPLKYRKKNRKYISK